MNTGSSTSPGHLLVFRGNEWLKELSLEEMQTVAAQWRAWFEKLLQQGKVSAGSPLEPEGKMVAGEGGRVVADGPFAESKEAIAGYFFLKVATLEEAVTIARQCPGLPHGAVVEVRPVAEQCPFAARPAKTVELAGATV